MVTEELVGLPKISVKLLIFSPEICSDSILFLLHEVKRKEMRRKAVPFSFNSFESLFLFIISMLWIYLN